MRGKKILFPIMLVLLVTIGALSGCSYLYKDDYIFLRNLQKGLEARWDANGSWMEESVAEKEKIGEISEYSFTYQNLESMAKEYCSLLEKEKQYANAKSDISEEKYYETRAEMKKILYQISKDFDLTVSNKYQEKLDWYLEDGRKVVEIYETLEKLSQNMEQAKMTSDGNGGFDILLDNDTNVSFGSVSMTAYAFDKDGVVIDEYALDYSSPLQAGESRKEKLYFPNFNEVDRVKVIFRAGYPDLDCFFEYEIEDLPVKNDYFIEISLINSLPTEIWTKDKYEKKIASLEIDSFQYVEDYWNNGLGNITVYLSGKKLSDNVLDNATDCTVGYVLYDEDGNEAYVGEETMGCFDQDESFDDIYTAILDIQPGKYTLELTDAHIMD